MTLPKTLSMLWLAVAAALAGTSAAAATAPAPATPTAKPAAGRAGWVDVTAGKHNGSGIRLSYNAPAMQPGRTTTIQLQFSGVSTEGASVEWRAPEGSTVTSSTAGKATSMALPRGQVTTLTLDVTPSADGQAYLDVFTVQNGRGSAQSVPLKVGSGAVHLKREGTVQTTPNGEAVVSLPSTPK